MAHYCEDASERSEYVSHDESTMDEFSSSGDESKSKNKRKATKRTAKSIRRLYMDSYSFEKSDEHGYTQMDTRGSKRQRRNTESDDYKKTVSRKKQCINRNALNARLNREKKKAYIASMEAELEELREKYITNQRKLVELSPEVDKLKQEVSQMKNLLANKFMYNLVNLLSKATGMPVTSSFLPKVKEENPAKTRSVQPGLNHPVYKDDVSLGGRDMFCPLGPQFLNDSLPLLENDYFLDDAKELFPFDLTDSGLADDKNLGICVHMNQQRLSVEFCAACNARATSN